MNLTDKITITNEDNMLLMARYPDNYFDFVLIDPPYELDNHGGVVKGHDLERKLNIATKNLTNFSLQIHPF
jgi:site-specific DNA-methyltransferase (adenine-specific)